MWASWREGLDEGVAEERRGSCPCPPCLLSVVWRQGQVLDISDLGEPTVGGLSHLPFQKLSFAPKEMEPSDLTALAGVRRLGLLFNEEVGGEIPFLVWINPHHQSSPEAL